MAALHRLSEFETAITGGYYRIDRTPYIEKYERADQPFVICLRPFGFNKELFLSMLRTYYAKDTSLIRQKLFQKLYIHRNLSPLFGSFYTFYLDFSSINPTSVQTIRNRYCSEVTIAINEFHEIHDLPSKTFSSDNPSLILNSFIATYEEFQLFVFINEYDYFHHEILDPGRNKFEAGKTGNNPVIKEIYAVLKQGLNKGLIDRIFVVGTDDCKDR